MIDAIPGQRQGGSKAPLGDYLQRPGKGLPVPAEMEYGQGIDVVEGSRPCCPVTCDRKAYPGPTCRRLSLRQGWGPACPAPAWASTSAFTTSLLLDSTGSSPPFGSL